MRSLGPLRWEGRICKLGGVDFWGAMGGLRLWEIDGVRTRGSWDMQQNLLMCEVKRNERFLFMLKLRMGVGTNSFVYEMQ